MARFVRGKKFEATVRFPVVPVQKIVEPMTRSVTGKTFETTVGFLTIPVQKLLKLWLDL